MVTQKAMNSQSNLEGKKKTKLQSQVPWLQTILLSYSPQDSVVLAQKQNYKSMGKDGKFRDKCTHL